MQDSYEITEIVLNYTKDQLEAWKNGDKSLIPDWVDIPGEVYNQSNYHFGEYFVLRYYSELGWQGFVNYAIGEWEPENPKYLKGRKKLEELLDKSKLSRIRDLRREIAGGEPDVFLYREPNELLFLEVKKGSDKVSDEQLTCLAQIREILGADVGIVYLKEETSRYSPRTYALNL